MYKFATEHGVKHILTGANDLLSAFATCSSGCTISLTHARSATSIASSESGHYEIFRAHRSFGIKFGCLYSYLRGAPVKFYTLHQDQGAPRVDGLFCWQPYPQKHFESRFTKFTRVIGCRNDSAMTCEKFNSPAL